MPPENENVEEVDPHVGEATAGDESSESTEQVIQQTDESGEVVLDMKSFTDHALLSGSKKGTPKVDEDEEEEPKKIEEDPAESKPVETKPTKGKPQARDLSDIPVEDQELFKKMSNEAFNKLKPIYLESKKPRTQATEVVPFYAHPKGYMLDDRHDQLAYNAQIYEQIADHWKMQEINIKKNGKFVDLQIDANGKLQALEEREATDKDEVNVSKFVAGASRKYAEATGEYENFVRGYKNNIEKDIKVLKQAEEQFFPEFDKEDHPTKKFQQQVLNEIPASLRTSPLAPLVAKLTAANALLRAEAKKLEDEMKKIKAIKKDAQAAPPKKSEFSASSNGSARKKEFAFSDFEKAAQGLI